MTLTIKVTRQDMLEGKRGVCGECPIALAAQRALALTDIDPRSAIVTSRELIVETPGHRRLRARLPRFVIDFIAAFDQRGFATMPREMAMPFEFTVDLPEIVTTLA